MKKRIDLHLHSRHSDGTLSPSELVKLAADQQISVIALADHDALSGIDEAVAAGVANGVEVIPAVELSVEFCGFEDIHILGYCMDHHDSQLCAHLDRFRKRRDSRGQEMVVRINEKLESEGKSPISFDEVLERSDGALGRPHIARVLMAKGHTGTMEESFDRYLVPCNVPKEFFPADQAIREIHRTGGVAVLAHPTTISRERTILRETIAKLAMQGLDGLEVYYSLGTVDDADFLLATARRLNLVVTGGSDFHGHADEPLPGAIGERFPIDYDMVAHLIQRARARKM
jgi:predicted metal-dependent phosphoesterase TrpH